MGRGAASGRRPDLLYDVHGLTGVEVTGGGCVGEHGLDHEDELGAVLAVVEHGRRVFGRRREVADAGLERGGRPVMATRTVAPALEGGELGFGNEEADLDVFGREQGDDGVTGSDEFALAVERVVDESGARGRLGIFGRRPSRSASSRRAAALTSASAAARASVRAAETGGGELGGEFVDGAEVALVGEAGAVVVGGGEDAGVEEVSLAGEIEGGELGGGAGLIEPGSRGWRVRWGAGPCGRRLGGLRRRGAGRRPGVGRRARWCARG